MIIIYKNFKRTQRVLLSILSTRHLMPNAKIYCLLQYLENESEYDEFLPAFKKLNCEVIYSKKRYGRANESGLRNNLNGLFFSEYINYIQKIFNSAEKIVIMDEDNYFTKGTTLNWINNTEFDLAFCHWPPPTPLIYKTLPDNPMNASIFAINFKKLSHLFPIPEITEYIETTLGHELVDKAINLKFNVQKIPTRDFMYYFGDGQCTNNIIEIYDDLKLHGILNTEMAQELLKIIKYP